MSIIKNLLLISLLLIFSACAKLEFLTKNSSNIATQPSSIFYKDGREALVIKCEGASWSECVTKAGNTCKEKGYEALEKNTYKESSYFISEKDIKELYFICKK